MSLPRDLWYIHDRVLFGLRDGLCRRVPAEDLKPLVDRVLDLDLVADEEMMLPVDMGTMGHNFHGVEHMTEFLGIVGTAIAFVRARDYYDPDSFDGYEPMTAGEWKERVTIAEGVADSDDDTVFMDSDEQDDALSTSVGSDDESSEGADSGREEVNLKPGI